MATRQPIILLALLVIVALLFTGCGKDEADESTAPTAQPVAAVASPTRGEASKGEQAFQATCIACHGADAKGVQGLGKSLHSADSEFVTSQTDDELVQFIKSGRQPSDPLNTTGIAMPPKGGNPAISDDDLYNIVAWLRTLN